MKAIGKSPITQQLQKELIQLGVQQGIAYATGAGMYPATMDSGTSGASFNYLTRIQIETLRTFF